MTAEQAAKAQGCTCDWFNHGTNIQALDYGCPVTTQHKAPNGPLTWAYQPKPQH